MRLQLSVAAALLACATTARGDRSASTWLAVYTDDDGLTVISPQLSVRADPHDGLEVEAAYDVDVISAASVDVVSQASPRGYSEERHGLLVGARWEPRADHRASLRYLPSWEPDYVSHGLAASAEAEWIARRLTTRGDARLTFDRIGRTGDDRALWQSATTEAVGLGLGWIASRRTLLQLTYELQHRHGYLANPYRFVEVRWPGAEPVRVAEVVPDSRWRHAAALAARHAIGAGWYGAVRYRLYADDWGVASHTGEWELQRAWAGDRLIASASGRLYHQHGARFYRQRYAVDGGLLPALRTADKLLAGSASALLGARLDAHLVDVPLLGALRATGKLELFEQVFRDVARITERRAVILSLGLAAEM